MDWRKKVEGYAEQRFAENRRYLEQKYQRKVVFDYRKEHVLTTTGLAVTLAAKTNAASDICFTSALLHDLGKCYQSALSAKENEKRAQNHAYYGAIEAKVFLETLNLEKDFIEEVVGAINQHEGLTRDLTQEIKPLSAAILWDADKLSKLGITSLLHHLAHLSSSGSETEVLIDVFANVDLDLMNTIAKHLNTVAAKKMAQQRLQNFKSFLQDTKLLLKGYH